MTRLECMKAELDNLKKQHQLIVGHFGKAACPVDLEQRIMKLQNDIKELEADKNRQTEFVKFVEGVCITAGLKKISDGEFRKNSLYEDEVKVKYDKDPDDDKFRVKTVTVGDYSIGEISACYHRQHGDTGEVVDSQRVIFKITKTSYSFSKDAYDIMLKFIRMHAPEEVSYFREAEYKWSITRLREVFSQQGMIEREWTPAESELNLG